MTGYSENCMLCGAKRPAGHVIVRSEDGREVEGRVCSSHTLKEVILDRSDRFLVEITVSNIATEMIERVHRKFGLILDV